MKLQKICVFCRRKNNNQILKFYSKDEESCDVCGGYLDYYLDGAQNTKTTNSTSAGHLASDQGSKQMTMNSVPTSNGANNPVSNANPTNKTVLKPMGGNKTSWSPAANTSANNNTPGSSKTSACSAPPAPAARKSIPEEVFESKNLIGLSSPKATLEKYYSDWDTEKLKSQVGRKSQVDTTMERMHFLIDGDELCGKSELAEYVVLLLNKTGIRSNDKPEAVRLKEFEGALGDKKALDELVDDYKGKSLLIVDSLDDAFTDKEGKINVDANKVKDLLYSVEYLMGTVTFIFECSHELKTKLYMNNPRMNDFFLGLTIDPYSEEELVALAKKRIQDDFRYVLREDAVDQLRHRIKRTSFEGYSQGRFITDALVDAKERLAKRLKDGVQGGMDARFTLIGDDFKTHMFNREEAQRILKIIDSKVGQESVKEYAHKVFDAACENERRAMEGKQVIKPDQPNFLLEGEAGVGKTTSSELLAQLLKACGVLKYDTPYLVSIGDLQTSAVGGTPEKVKQVFDAAKGHLIVIDEAYTLAGGNGGVSGNYGQEVVDTITNELGKANRDIIVALVGYVGSLDAVLKMNKGMPRRFPNRIVLKDYSLEQLTDIFVNKVKEKGFTFENGAKELVSRLVDLRRRTENFGNAGGVISLVDRLTQSDRSGRDLITREAMLSEIGQSNGSDVESILEELRAMIGIREVKNLVEGLTKMLKGRERQIQNGLLKADAESYNMIFLGPQGTGKTTVCRLIARLYAGLGILRYSDRIIETDGKAFIAEYTGQTESKAEAIVNSAIGGILYIDEVYEMNNGTAFGQSAIDSLTKLLDSRKDELMVIISGYEDKVTEFLNMNRGLSSRFPTKIHFEPYTEDELVQIFRLMVEKKEHRYTDVAGVEANVRSWIRCHIHESSFGNGRDIRNLVEKCIFNLRVRIGQDENIPCTELDLIKAQDVPVK